jgi:hypothetical protein
MSDEKSDIRTTPNNHDALPEKVERDGVVDSSSSESKDVKQSGGMKSFFVGRFS